MHQQDLEYNTRIRCKTGATFAFQLTNLISGIISMFSPMCPCSVRLKLTSKSINRILHLDKNIKEILSVPVVNNFVLLLMHSGFIFRILQILCGRLKIGCSVVTLFFV